jgi:tRNA pseudouridine55 synthase
VTDGILLLDKHAGPTSHDAVAAVRRLLGERRVGHAGTLDPQATGLLVVLLGRATRLARFIGMLPKSYRGTVRFGWESTTDDMAGEPAGPPDEGWRRLTRRDIEEALRTVAAQPTQVPPAVSAKKVHGERSYERARRGERVSLAPVPVRIHALSAEPWTGAEPELHIEVTCSAGTYVRALARDLGRALGTAAHLGFLRRTAVGPWRVEEAVALEAVQSGASTGAAGAMRLRPMREAVAHLPSVALAADAAARFVHGQKLPADAPAGAVAVYDGGQLVGVALAKDGLLHPDVVLAA